MSSRPIALSSTISELEPEERSGSGTPVSGARPSGVDVDQRLKKNRDVIRRRPAWRTRGGRLAAQPAEQTMPKSEEAGDPREPSSSPITERMKSVCSTGRKKTFCPDWPGPTPTDRPSRSRSGPGRTESRWSGGVRPGVQEGGEPLAAIGLEQREDHDHNGHPAGDEQQLAQRQPRRDEHRGEREPDHERRAEIGLRLDEKYCAAAGQEDRPGDAAQAAG